MDFLIGFIVGLFIGSWVGLGVASVIAISRDKEAEARMNGDPDGSKAVLDEMLAKMRESKRVPTCLANEERRKELEERYKEE